MSIQQPLDGHSFSLPEGPERPSDGAPVEVELLMARTMLVPESLYAPDRAAAWFAVSGMPLSEKECVVASEPRSGCVALIAIPQELSERLRGKWGEELRFTTPLLHEPSVAEQCVRIERAGGLVYFKLYDTALKMAEVLPADTDDDLLYFIERLAACFPLREYSLCLAGEDSKKVRRLIGKRFKRVVCE